MLFDLHGVIPEVGHSQIPEEKPAVSVGVCADAAVALGSQRLDLRKESPAVVKEFLRVIALQPFFQDLKVFLTLFHGNGNLVSQVIILYPLTVHHLGAGPALGRAEDYHGPHRAVGSAVLSGIPLDLLYALDHLIHGLSHLAVHGHGV